jgi:FlaG/FlaF family flagellin (archaellin)
MRKLFKSGKALSPVVAAIILIAVIAAVSIAVAAWMGVLTFASTGSSPLNIYNVTFTRGNGLTNDTMVLYFNNTGTKEITISLIKVNNVVEPYWSASQTTLSPTIKGLIVVQMGKTGSGWVSGSPCDITVYDPNGTLLGSTRATPQC